MNDRILTRLAFVSAVTLAPLTAAAQDTDIRAFFFGNSLVHHLTETEETTIPYWLHQLAVAGGQGFAADGTWGFPEDFGTNLPPEPQWIFDDVPRVWDRDDVAFRRAGFNTIIFSPANFVHYDPPDADVNGPSVVDWTRRVFDWTANQAPGAQFLLYEGWSNMEDITDYPPDQRGMDSYHAFNMGDYHDWNVAYAAAVQAALPQLDITLIPVASVLARVLTETALSGIPAEALYSDISPHGTPTKYLLAAMVTYAVLYDEPPPVIDLPDIIHPVLRDNYAQAVSAIWSGVSGAVLPEGAEGRLPTGHLENPWLSVGLSGIADYSSQMPFIDVMKSARTWTGHTVDQWGAWDATRLEAEGYLDANGWLKAIPPELDRVDALILTDMPVGARSLVGRYRVTYDGQGEVSVAYLARDPQYAPGEIWFWYRPEPGIVAISISATNPADPVRNIKVIHEDNIALYDAGARFNPDWLRLIGDMRALRFMDWMGTNGSTQVAWADRPTPDDYTFTRRGVPVEVMVDLANAVGADPWFNMPHQADDAYVAAFATYVRDNLNPALKAHVEWSNEVWNWSFPQATWADEQGKARWGADAGGDVWMQFAGLRAAQVADIWTATFGDAAVDRLVQIIATQTGWLGLESPLLDAPLAQAEGLAAPSDSFDAYAVSGYFGYEMGTEEMNPTVHGWIADGNPTEQMTTALRDGSLAQLTGEFFPYHAQVAKDHGLRMVMYEGGTHIAGVGLVVDDDALTDFFTEYNYGPAMAPLFAELFAGWQAAGGTLFTAFVDVAEPSKWGSWGALRHLDDMNPRWATMTAHNALMPVTWENRVTGTFLGTAESGSETNKD